MTNVFNFEFYVPTDIVFGAGEFNSLGERAKRFGDRAMLITYPDFPYTNKAMQLLAATGLDPLLFDKVVGESYQHHD